MSITENTPPQPSGLSVTYALVVTCQIRHTYQEDGPAAKPLRVAAVESFCGNGAHLEPTWLILFAVVLNCFAIAKSEAMPGMSAVALQWLITTGEEGSENRWRH